MSSRACGLLGEGDALEGRLAGLARVAIPHAAAHEVDPAVAVDVQGGQADVGPVIRPHVMPDPVVGPAVLEPVESLGPRDAAAADEVEVAVAVQVRQGGEAVIPLAAVRGQVERDEMVPELEILPRLRPMRLRRGPGDDLPFFRVELVEQPPGVEIERASRAILRGAAAGAVVEAPAGGPAGHGAAQVGEEVAADGSQRP